MTSKTHLNLKTCSVCKEEKDFSKFYTRLTGAGTKRPASRCRECYTLPEYREAANKRNRKYERTTRADLYRRDPKLYLWGVAKKRAKLKGMEFSITPEDIIFDGYCPITKRRIDTGTNKLDTSMSLDRVDNDKGYVKGNVVAISRWANLRKSDMTKGDLEGVLEYMEKYS